MVNDSERNIIMYKTMMSIVCNMRKSGILTVNEAEEAEALFAEKYGLNKRSIYRDIAG